MMLRIINRDKVERSEMSAKARIGERIKLKLNHGDIYIMSEKATGFDWKKKLLPTLRHAAGCQKFLTM